MFKSAPFHAWAKPDRMFPVNARSYAVSPEDGRLRRHPKTAIIRPTLQFKAATYIYYFRACKLSLLLEAFMAWPARTYPRPAHVPRISEIPVHRPILGCGGLTNEEAEVINHVAVNLQQVDRSAELSDSRVPPSRGNTILAPPLKFQVFRPSAQFLAYPANLRPRNTSQILWIVSKRRWCVDRCIWGGHGRLRRNARTLRLAPHWHSNFNPEIRRPHHLPADPRIVGVDVVSFQASRCRVCNLRYPTASTAGISPCTRPLPELTRRLIVAGTDSCGDPC